MRSIVGRAAPAALAGSMLLAAASPVWAHGAEPGAVSTLTIGLGVGGLLALVLAALISYRGGRRTGLAVFIGGFVLMALAGADFVVDKGGAPMTSDVRIEVLEPRPGATVTSPVTIKVDLVGAILVPIGQRAEGPNEGHLHVAVDGRTTDMPTNLEFAVDLPPGKHLLQIEYTGADHMSFSPPVQQILEVTVLPPGAIPTPSSGAEALTPQAGPGGGV